jgi:hypothetical protein
MVAIATIAGAADSRHHGMVVAADGVKELLP